MKSRQDIKDLMEKIYQDLQATREAGQKEYAHGEDNAFGNFDRLAQQLKMDREKILWVYVQKHIDGVVSYLNGHRSQREDVRGRIKDIIVYLILLWGMVDDNELEPTKFHNVRMDSNVVSAKKKKFWEADPHGPDISTHDATCKNCGKTFDIHNLIDAGLGLFECPT